MIVKLNQEDAQLLANFLVDVTRVNTPKQYRQPVVKVLQDVKSFQINSKRFLFIFPVLQSAHAMFHNQVARLFGWRRIARWKRILFFPALVEYLTKVRPLETKYRKQLNQVARLCKRLKEQCGEGK